MVGILVENRGGGGCSRTSKPDVAGGRASCSYPHSVCQPARCSSPRIYALAKGVEDATKTFESSGGARHRRARVAVRVSTVDLATSQSVHSDGSGEHMTMPQILDVVRLHDVPAPDSIPPTPAPPPLPPIDPEDPVAPAIPVQEPPSQQPPLRMHE